MHRVKTAAAVTVTKSLAVQLRPALTWQTSVVSFTAAVAAAALLLLAPGRLPADSACRLQDGPALKASSSSSTSCAS